MHEGGLLLKIEGGLDEEWWMMPPDVDALQPAAKDAVYEFKEGGEPVTDVDYEAYWSIADDVDALRNRRRDAGDELRE